MQNRQVDDGGVGESNRANKTSSGEQDGGYSMVDSADLVVEHGERVATVGGAGKPSGVSHMLGQSRADHVEVLGESYGSSNGSSFIRSGSPLHQSCSQQTPSPPPRCLLSVPPPPQ